MEEVGEVVSYALIKAPSPLLPQLYVTLGVLVHNDDNVWVKFSHDPSLAVLCAPVLARTRFDALETIFSGAFQEEKFLTSRDEKGNIIEIDKSKPDFLELMSEHWQDSALRMEYGGNCKRQKPEAALDSLYKEKVLGQDITSLSGQKIRVTA